MHFNKKLELELTIFFSGKDFKNWQNWFLLRNWKKLFKWVAQSLYLQTEM